MLCHCIVDIVTACPASDLAFQILQEIRKTGVASGGTICLSVQRCVDVVDTMLCSLAHGTFSTLILVITTNTSSNGQCDWLNDLTIDELNRTATI